MQKHDSGINMTVAFLKVVSHLEPMDGKLQTDIWSWLYKHRTGRFLAGTHPNLVKYLKNLIPSMIVSLKCGLFLFQQLSGPKPFCFSEGQNQYFSLSMLFFHSSFSFLPSHHFPSFLPCFETESLNWVDQEKENRFELNPSSEEVETQNQRHSPLYELGFSSLYLMNNVAGHFSEMKLKYGEMKFVSYKMTGNVIIIQLSVLFKWKISK